MGRYAVRRSLTIVPVLLGVSILVFSFIHLIPGDPALTMLGERATPEKVAEVRARLGLVRPIWQQYVLYVGHALRGDLGVSIVRGDPVASDLLRRFPATVELAVAAIVVAIALGIPIGVASAVYRNSLLDSLARLGALTGVSMPIFWLGLVLAWFFGVQLRILPTGFRLASGSAFVPWTNFVILDALLQGDWTSLADALRHLVLPALALAMAGIGQTARLTRASMVETYQKPYIEMAQAYGFRERRIANRYAFRPALVPVLTILGLDLAALLGNAFLVESVFGWPGLSRYGVEVILHKDLDAIVGTVLIIATGFLIANIVVDLLVAVVNPRIRFATGQS